MQRSPHTFHIPVMGLAFTIDSPIKVARFGISSVMSIVEDKLIEMMRSHYYPSIGKPYFPIGTNESDYRAKRITDYLNLVNVIVQNQVEKLKNAAFETGSEIAKYFEMLPEDSVLKQLYRKMIALDQAAEKEILESYLRSQIRAGNIDVNIMTKTDRNNFDTNSVLIEDGSDAVSALRGYANSDLKNSSVIFSAGMNPRLYNYLGSCKAFEMNEDGGFSKKVTVKVSDYRSALIQGKYLAKKGIWVSEFRVESGLNCGGHAFATEGYLMGPILEEFKRNRKELSHELLEIYNVARRQKELPVLTNAQGILLSAQGGIGSQAEDEFLRNYYGIDSTGWGTPFLLVPEATTVDDDTLKLLCEAKEKDVVLSRNSPLGVRFYYLKGSSGEKEKLLRISNGKPGSPCTEKHLEFNTEFTKDPICTASQKYQKLKIAQLKSLQLPEPQYKRQVNDVLAKECLCVGLSNAAAIVYDHTFVKKREAVNICPGPNIANFSAKVSLQTMTDHIYGRNNILSNPHRPHMFVAELQLYIHFLKEQLEETDVEEMAKKKKYFVSFYGNLRDGIKYYKGLSLLWETDNYLLALEFAGNELDFLNYTYALEVSVGCEVPVKEEIGLCVL